MADIFDLFKKISEEKKTDSGKIEYIVVGLGNPGDKYTYTRHNAGFLAMDYISQKLGGTIRLVGDVIETQIKYNSNYHLGAAMSLVLMVFILISLAIMNKFSDDDGGMIV